MTNFHAMYNQRFRGTITSVKLLGYNTKLQKQEADLSLSTWDKNLIRLQLRVGQQYFGEKLR